MTKKAAKKPDVDKVDVESEQIAILKDGQEKHDLAKHGPWPFRSPPDATAEHGRPILQLVETRGDESTWYGHMFEDGSTHFPHGVIGGELAKRQQAEVEATVAARDKAAAKATTAKAELIARLNSGKASAEEMQTVMAAILSGGKLA